MGRDGAVVIVADVVEVFLGSKLLDFMSETLSVVFLSNASCHLLHTLYSLVPKVRQRTKDHHLSL
jgi:hypothetical protein